MVDTQRIDGKAFAAKLLLDITAEVATTTDNGVESLIASGALGDLDWRGIHYLEESGRHLLNLIEWLLNTPDGAAHAATDTETRAHLEDMTARVDAGLRASMNRAI